MVVDAEVVVAYVVLAARRPELGRAMTVRLDRLVRAVSWRMGADAVAAAGTEDDEAVARLVAWIDATALQDQAFLESLAQLQFELDARGGRALLGEETSAPQGEEAVLMTDVYIARADLARALTAQPLAPPVAQPVAAPLARPVAAPTVTSSAAPSVTRTAPQRIRPSASRVAYAVGIVLCLAGLVPVALAFVASANGTEHSAFSTPVLAGFGVFVLGFVVAIAAAVRIAPSEPGRSVGAARDRYSYAGRRDTHAVGV